ncbi:hypothetical protein C8R43DRAFT_1012732 [Mycena crocata]|nr:hypothetical protein C8R43DRAFT_1012732 [Mycena crocata]
MLSSKSKNDAEGGRFECGREDLVVVDAMALSTTIGNESGLVVLNRAIGLVLDNEDPLRANRLHIRRSINYIPSAVLQKRVDLRNSCFLPKMSIFTPKSIVVGAGIARLNSSVGHLYRGDIGGLERRTGRITCMRDNERSSGSKKQFIV